MVSRKTLKIFFWSESFSIRTSEGRAPASELVLQRGSLPSEIALQRGKPRVQNGVSRGRCGLRKTEKIFSANNVKNILFFKPLYTNKKVQLQLDFFD